MELCKFYQEQKEAEEEYYYLAIQNNKVVVYRADGQTVYMETDIPAQDLPDDVLAEMDIVIASLHIGCLKPGSREENTSAYIGAIQNKHVDIIGHPDDTRYKIDYETVIRTAKQYGTLIELNNASLSPDSFRRNAKDTDLLILKLCSVPVIVGSDAHTEEDILNFEYADQLLVETSFPVELIANTSAEKLHRLLAQRSSYKV